MDVWIANNGIIYDLYHFHRADDIRSTSENYSTYPPSRRRGHVVAMRFAGAEYFWSIRSVGRRSGAHNYIGISGAPEIIEAPLYDELHISDITTGAGLRLYFEDRMLRYDVILPAGGDPGQLRLSIQGASCIGINSDGELAITTSMGDLLQRRLYAYQEIDGARRQVACAFKILPGMNIGFDVGAYDRSRSLVIDPLVWSTFLGGSGYERSTGIARAANGDLFITGYTSSSNFPTTVGAYDVTFDSISAAFVTKLNSTGTQLLYSTFIGGAGGAWSMGIAVDNVGCAYITGCAGAGYPTTSGAYKTAPVSGLDAFITKLNASGNALAYSTCLGGEDWDCANGVAIDNAGLIYVTGSTVSSDFPTTSGAYDRTHGGMGDIFAARLSPAGLMNSDLQYSTFIGGSSGDTGHSVTVDASGNIYVTGNSSSATYPISTGAFDATHNGLSDVVLSKIKPSGGGGGDLLYSTFIGGSGSEQGRGIDLGPSGHINVVGISSSSAYPTTRNAFDTTYNGNIDGFFFRLNPVGLGENDLLYSTFIGGSSGDAANGVIADDSGKVLIVGMSVSSDFPTTPSAYDAVHNGDSDVVILRLNPLGTLANDLIYSTYAGGNGADEGVAIVADDPDSIYVSGSTSSSGFPVASAYDVTHNGGKDAFVALIIAAEDNMNENGFDFSNLFPPDGPGVSTPREVSLKTGICQLYLFPVIVPGYPAGLTLPQQEPSQSHGDDARGTSSWKCDRVNFVGGERGLRCV